MIELNHERRRVIISHGINTTGGGVYKLGELLKADGYNVIFADYEIRHFWSYYNRKNMVRDGRQLASIMRDGDYFIGHSNAGIVWQQSIAAGAKWGKCVLLGAACTSDQFHYPHDSLEEAIVYYNSYDRALQFGSFLPWHPFGRMGRRGFAWNPAPMEPEPDDWVGLDRRFDNRPIPSKEWLQADHSHYFSHENMKIVHQDVKKFFGAV